MAGVKNSRMAVFKEGIHDGIPISLGYFVVSFTLGIPAAAAGLTPLEGFVTSLLNNASAGEYAAFTVMAADAPYIEMAIMTLVANARYMLMSCVISQRMAPETPLIHRMGVGFDLTDEIFGITVARPGPVDPFYNYVAMTAAMPGWAGGTALGILAGNVLPENIVSALSVALFGMFLWVIVTPARTDKAVGVLICMSFLASLAASLAPYISDLSGGTRTILLTVVLAAAAAVLKPVEDDRGEDYGA